MHYYFVIRSVQCVEVKLPYTKIELFQKKKEQNEKKNDQSILRFFLYRAYVKSQYFIFSFIYIFTTKKLRK